MTEKGYSKGVRKNMKKNMSDKIFIISAYTFLAVFALFCLYPLLLTLGVSLSDENMVAVKGYRLIPEKFSLDTYTYLFVHSGQRIIHAYGITIFITAVGTISALLITAMMAFSLSIKTLKYRNAIAKYSNFTIIFSAGIIPWYIVCVNYLHLSNNILGLIFPYLLSVWNLFLLRSYFQAIPDSIIESAKIDGANYFQIFAKIAVPLTSTGLLTIGMMYALQYWNDWWLSIMFITKRDLFPLQYYLFNIMSNVQALTSGRVSNIGSKISLPTETVKMAVTVVAIGPIIFIYPFIQRYFVKGIMTGAVKG